VLVRGPAGWGELSPFPDYPRALVDRCIAAAREAAQSTWPPARRASIPVNVTVPALQPEEAWRLVKDSGCTTAKVKVAAGDDVGRVEAVRDALGRSGRIRIDVNAAWDVDVAARRISELARFDIEYVEQPVATLDDMAALRLRVDVPLALDESIRTAPDPLRIDARRAADVAVLKVQPLGGVAATLRVAEACGLPAVISSALETSVGLCAGIAAAAALHELPYACGLGTAALLAGDVVAEPLLPRAGEVPVRRVVVDPDALAPHEAAAAGDEWIDGLVHAVRAGAVA
jgi:O-succinylbenzoate synthase